MITINPLKSSLVPVHSDAASELTSKNYDEFNSTIEVWQAIKKSPKSILRVKMPHCDVIDSNEIGEEGTVEAISRAKISFQNIKNEGLLRRVENSISIYRIKTIFGHIQTGIICAGLTSEIRTESTPNGSIIRNEGVNAKKVEGRKKIIGATSSFMGIVSNAINDDSNAFREYIKEVIGNKKSDISVTDEAMSEHSIWIITDLEVIDKFQQLLKAEPCAYVADGNHRSAAAAGLGYHEFLMAIFPMDEMKILAYDRLINLKPGVSIEDALSVLRKLYSLTEFSTIENKIGSHSFWLYLGSSRWVYAVPKEINWNSLQPDEQIDHQFLQKNWLDIVCDSNDENGIKYVGGSYENSYLVKEVDKKEFDLALFLQAVSNSQFVNVCNANQYMPPKSTWFFPKVRSGLVIAQL